MKKISEWLKTIADVEVRDKALKNMENTMDEEVDSLGMAIKSAFTWSKTPEGHFYWSGVYANYTPYP